MHPDDEGIVSVIVILHLLKRVMDFSKIDFLHYKNFIKELGLPEQKKIQKIIAPREKHWVGDGFHVSTIFSMHSEDVDSISPFLLMDHAAPRYFPPTHKNSG